MRKGWFGRLGLAATIGVVAMGGVSTVGCGKAQEPISQVQANYVRKADLIGDPSKPNEWYLRTTVVDTRRTNSFAFPGLQDELKRVRWDVQENYLVARRSYELVSGSDGKGAKPSEVNGGIVAMYKIESHFDIRRAYNPGTYEEQNIIVENTVDRPWYDRDYMRVDWTRNLVTDTDMFFFTEIFDGLKFTPVQYAETDPKSPNAMVQDFPNGYFDVTAKWMMETEKWQFSWGTLPVCLIMNLYTGSDTEDCNDQDVTVRQSFMKVKDTDYEPAETNGAKFAMFGTFNRDRYGYDRQYGVTDSNWHRMMARHNIWQKSHYTQKEKGLCGVDGNKPAGDAFCASSNAASSCDMHAKLCTLPVETRTVKPVAYHLSAKMPESLHPANQGLIDTWNGSLKEAVAAAREVECRRFGGGDKASCHAKFYDGDKPKGEDVVVMCHNPVNATDNKACGPVGTSAREGDLRYSFLGWVPQALSAAPLGYGPDGADPLTGEVVQATAYVYGGGLDTYAGMARDLVLVALGDIKPEDYVNGKHLEQVFGKANLADKRLEAVASQFAQHLGGGDDAHRIGLMTDADIKSRVAGLDPSEQIAKLNSAGAVAGKSAADRLAAVKSIISAKGQKGDIGFGGQSEADASVAKRSALAKGSDVEKTLTTNPQYLVGAALNPLGTAEDMAAATTPFGGLDAMGFATLRKQFAHSLEKRGVCMLSADEFNAPHFEGLAKRYAAKYAGVPKEERRQKIFEDLRIAIYKGVQEHEVGHTLALRHNFQGTWDSVNFSPQYWKLRSQNGAHLAADKACGAAHAPANDTCMGPRYLDPESPEENGVGAKPHAGIEEFSYSSIMDYGLDFNSDLHSIGSYDRAAMKFIYGGTVETFEQPNDPVALKIAPTLATSPLSEQWHVKRTDPALGAGEQILPTHYTTLARILGKKLFDSAKCRAADPNNAHEMEDAIDGQVCEKPARDVAHVDELMSGTVDGAPGYEANHWKTKDGRIRWPYRFGTDDYASNPHIRRFDAGADVFEAAVQSSRLYEYRYVLDYFRRGRRGWAPYLSLQGRIWQRYFTPMKDLGWLAHSKTTQYGAMYPDKTSAENPALQSDDLGRGYALAATVLFETFERAILRPQPGEYEAKAERPDAKKLFEVADFDQGGAKSFKIGLTDGRYVDSVYNNDIGGSFGYLNYTERMGTFLEKDIAWAGLSMMWSPVHNFSRDTYLDGRNELLNFRSVMPKAYDRLMAAVLAEDWDLYAPWVDTAKKDAAGYAIVNYPKLWEEKVERPTASTVLAVDPLQGYAIQSGSIIYSLWLGTEDGSQGITNKMRVWIDGGPEGLAIPESDKTFVFEPESGVTWVARKYGTEAVGSATDVRDQGIGSRMVDHANRLLADAYCVELEADGMPKYTADHRPIWAACEAGQPVVTGKARDLEKAKTFRRYVGLLNVTRDVMWTFGFGSGPLR